MNINRLRQKLHEMIDACDDKDLLDHFFQVLTLEKVTHSPEFSMELDSESYAALSEELDALSHFDFLKDSDDPLDYPEFASGYN
jgi:hypothetical protein